jgi:hypothetical protein
MELANIANRKIKNCFGIEKFQGRKKIGCARHSSEVVLISSAQALCRGVVAAAVSANLMRSMYALRNPVRNLVQPPTMLVLLPDFVDDKELEDRRGITRSMAPDAANGSRQEKWPD